MTETVDHPDHYGGDRHYEVIKVIEMWLTHEEFRGAMKFLIIKYAARLGKKDDPHIEAGKIRFYASVLEEFEKHGVTGRVKAVMDQFKRGAEPIEDPIEGV